MEIAPRVIGEDETVGGGGGGGGGNKIGIMLVINLGL